MNKADLLMAGLRQLAAGKAAPRTGIQSATVAKDGKDKAEHFREQLRLIAQGTKHAAKPAVEGAEKRSDASRGSRGSRCESCGPDTDPVERPHCRAGRRFLQIRLPRKRRRRLRIGAVRKPP